MQEEFTICNKNRQDTAPDPDKHLQWRREQKAKVKFYACKQCIQKSYVGHLEGTETLAQHVITIKQKCWDNKINRFKHRSVQELSQEHQRLLAQIKPTTIAAEMPQMDNVFVQAVS
jgi:hypothetical protein